MKRLKLNLNELLVIVGVCALAGIVIGEFFPDFMSRGLGSFGAKVSDPFSEYRNRIAVRYAVCGAAIGAIAAIAWRFAGGEKR
jgi:hypothetical protein